MVSSPNSRGIYAVAIVLGITSILTVGLRFRARKALAKRINAGAWRSDDWLVFMSMLFIWGLAIILIYGASVDTIGTHTRLNPKTGAVIVTPHENQIAMFGGISQILSVLALGTLKAGAVMFYRRIFVGAFFKQASLAVLLLIIVWTVAFFFATILECKGRNLDLLWKSIKTFITVCYEYKTIQLAHCITDVITDLIVLSLPLREIWRLHMSMRQKITVSLIFMIGLVATAAGVARLVIVSEDIVETTAGARDVRGVETNVLVWTFVEIGVGIVAASLPTLGPIVNRRGLESIIASVRSMVSLHTLGSGGSRSVNTSDPKVTRREEELIPYPGAGLNETRTEIGRGDSTHKFPNSRTIRREDSVTVSSDHVE